MRPQRRSRFATRAHCDSTRTLTLTSDPDPDGTVRLTATATSGEFAGQGSAWFAPEQLAQWGQAIQAYPLAAEQLPLLEGGYWERGGKVLIQCHLRLRVVHRHRRGALAIEVQLATPKYENGDVHALRQSVSLEVATEYEALRQFGLEVVAMAEGRANDAQLASSDCSP